LGLRAAQVVRECPLQPGRGVVGETGEWAISFVHSLFHRFADGPTWPRCR